MEALIQELLKEPREANIISNSDPIKEVGGRLRVGIRSSEPVLPEVGPTLVLVDLSTTFKDPQNSTDLKPSNLNLITPSSPAPPTILEVPSYYPKQYPAQFLTHTLPTSLKFIQSHLAASPNLHVTILCKDGKDLSVGIATAALANYFDESGLFVGQATDRPSKESIRRRLQWVLSSRPGANPARATLKRVNEYLMSPNRPSLQRIGTL